MLKDRIKEWMRQFLMRKVTRWLWDYDVKIRDPVSNVTIGRCREAFSFVDAEHVPKDVMARRNADTKSVVDPTGKPEVIMRYEKNVMLRGVNTGDRQDRRHDINDIIRFNISDFLVRTDDPVRSIRFYNAQTDLVETATCPKVYHLNVVFVLRGAADRPHSTLSRVRVIFNKHGILRMEDA
jgi:hypothetical protein